MSLNQLGQQGGQGQTMPFQQRQMGQQVFANQMQNAQQNPSAMSPALGLMSSMMLKKSTQFDSGKVKKQLWEQIQGDIQAIGKDSKLSEQDKLVKIFGIAQMVDTRGEQMGLSPQASGQMANDVLKLGEGISGISAKQKTAKRQDRTAEIREEQLVMAKERDRRAEESHKQNVKYRDLDAEGKKVWIKDKKDRDEMEIRQKRVLKSISRRINAGSMKHDYLKNFLQQNVLRSNVSMKWAEKVWEEFESQTVEE